MIKGLFTGVLAGLAVSGFGAAAISLTTELPRAVSDVVTPPAAPQIEAPAVAEGPVISDLPPGEPVAEATPGDPQTAPEVAAPMDAPSTPLADSTPLALPETAAVTGALEAPADVTLPDLDSDPESPVFATPQSLPPSLPRSEADVVISTAPATPTAESPPVPETVDVVTVVDTPEAVETAPDMAAEAEENAPSEVPASDAVVVDDSAAPMPPVPDAAPQTMPVEMAESSDVQPAETIVPPDVIVDDVPPDASLADPVESTPAEPIGSALAEADMDPGSENVPPAESASAESAVPKEAPSDVIAGTEEEPAPPVVVAIIDESSNALPTGSPDVRINRSPGTQADPEVAVEIVPEEPALPALQRFAAAFANPEGKPLLALILLDEGDLPLAALALREIPFPVTVALDPASPDATERMAAYRTAGIEVAMRPALPDGATPADVEISLEAGFAMLPETVLMIDVGELDARGRVVTDQMIAALAEDGRGYVTVSSGLNSSLRSAELADVPAALVYRDLDGEGQDARVIRRFLDQAAFRARQEGSVVLLGRVRAETLSALILWGTANRASQVAVAPASAILLAQ